MSLRIRQRLTLSFVLVTGLAAVVAGAFLHVAIGRWVQEQVASRLLQESHLVRSLVAEEENLAASADDLADWLGQDLGVRVTIIAADGTVLGDTDLDGAALRNLENHADRPEIVAALRDGSGQSVRYSNTIREHLLYAALRIDPAIPERGVVRLAVALTAVRSAQQAIWLPLLIAAFLAVIAAAIFGHWVSRSHALRLDDLSRAASEIASGHTEARAVARGQDEVTELAGSLNRMAGRLEDRLTLLSRERNRLATVLEGMVEGVLLTDARGTILLANSAFQRIFDAQAPIEGRRPLETARVPALQDAVDAALRATSPVTREITLGGDQEKVIRASLAAIREGSEVAGAVAVFHDVTELKRLERVRREFVSNVSHELRTPLTAIKGYAETLRDGQLEDRQKISQFVEVIHRHAERLGALIEDLLDLAAVEQGQTRLQPRPLPLSEVTRQVEAVIRPAVEEKGQSLEVRVPDDLPMVVADRDRLAQVLINLVDNAVKFTPEHGKIQLSASAAQGRVGISVTDNGIGIPAGEIDRIFERFYRSDRSRDRREGGTGLGLAIAKHLVQAMGGTIDVTSAPGAGATFTVTLPAA